MENLLNKQICINCKHAEKWHNTDESDQLMCMAFIANYIADMTEGLTPGGSSLSRCGCKTFKMDNLKYLEENVQHGRDNK